MSLDRIPGDANLYVGGLFSLRRHEALKKANITHVVSALRLPLDQDLVRKFQHHLVDIDDVDEENIIQYFPAASAFITDGLAGGGGVLIHCAMGKSRSVTLLIAYLLSTLPRTTSNTPATILSLIRQSRPMAEPIPGFMAQLALYHRMNMPSTVHELDSHPEYQRWLYQRAVEESNFRGVAPEIGEICFADASRTSSADDASSTGASAEGHAQGDPPLSEPQAGSEEKNPPNPQPLLAYRCRRCRHQLATSKYVLEHAPGDALKFPTPQSPNQQPPYSSSANNTRRGSGAPCAHLFIEPLSWMRPELEQGKLDGRLECPNPMCGTSVGRYAWQGLRCSCGAWVVPGVSLARGKVDEVKEARHSVRRLPREKDTMPC